MSALHVDVNVYENIWFRRKYIYVDVNIYPGQSERGNTLTFSIGIVVIQYYDTICTSQSV